MIRTPLCDELGIEVPIFAFSHCRDVVVAVSRAGGLGVLGALAFSPAELETELRWIDEHIGGKPYGVDVVMPAKLAGDEKAKLETMIPEAHKQFVAGLMQRFEVPPLPEGEHVETGTVICVVEAMKMENEIAAHRPGTVTHLAVAPGARVTGGQVLCIVTPPEDEG